MQMNQWILCLQDYGPLWSYRLCLQAAAVSSAPFQQIHRSESRQESGAMAMQKIDRDMSSSWSLERNLGSRRQKQILSTPTLVFSFMKLFSYPWTSSVIKIKNYPLTLAIAEGTLFLQTNLWGILRLWLLP